MILSPARGPVHWQRLFSVDIRNRVVSVIGIRDRFFGDFARYIAGKLYGRHVYGQPADTPAYFCAAAPIACLRIVGIRHRHYWDSNVAHHALREWALHRNW